MSDAHQVAMHEAGHAVVAVLLDFALRSTRIYGAEAGGFLNSVDGVNGRTDSDADRVKPDNPDSRLKYRAALVALAGREARRLNYPDADAESQLVDADDLSNARKLLPGDALLEAAAKARELVSAHADAIRAVADLLVSRGLPAEVSGPEVRELVRSHERRGGPTRG